MKKSPPAKKLTEYQSMERRLADRRAILGKTAMKEDALYTKK